MFKQALIVLFMASATLAVAQKVKEAEAHLYAPVYSLYYQSGKWELTSENAKFLDLYVVEAVEKSDIPKVIFYVEGHTDEVGNSDYNMILSQKRAQTVVDYLISRGFGSNQIKTSFFGELKPEIRKIAISNKSKDIRYANRRVVVRIEKKY